MFDELMESRKNKIIDFINDKNYTPMNINDISFIFQVPDNERELLNDIVNGLLKEGKAVLTKKGKIMSPESMNLVYGIFTGHAKGFGFVAADKFEGDIFIPPTYTNGAMHKDKVLCRIISESAGGKRREGEIVKVLERGIKVIIGTYEELRKGHGFVVPDDKKISGDIHISNGYNKGAVTGHKVVVKITKPAGEDKNPEGVITEILGHKNDPGVDILSIILKHELSIEFSEKVYKEMEKIQESVTVQDIADRTDLRNTAMVTIDGEDAKDLDDAVSLEILQNGNYKLGVHIADVSHYIKENTELDKEALERGTSVYLADRVIPMIPHKLSNGICSLNPNVDRLTLSCIMEINANGDVVNHTVCESVITTNRRMTYTIVNDILTNQDSEYMEEYKELVPMFRQMEDLSRILREKRIKRGAIEFGFAESKIIVDENGKPVDIKPYVRNRATSLIEEFMLVCNETIAEEYFWMELPFVYRTHEEPDPEKIQALSEFINKFGFHLKGSHPKSIQKLLASVENKPEEIIISKVALRSLKQARYTVLNEGHFGLAAKYYCHFTSPIRRYPDLQIHRIIKRNITSGLTERDIEKLSKELPEVCKLCSRNERNAEETEREVDNVKKAQYMADKIGETFSGIISGVTSWGLYVELPNTVEGMVSINDLDDDYYIFDEKNMYYIGEHLKKTYSLGDKVQVTLKRVYIQEGKIDFVFSD